DADRDGNHRRGAMIQVSMARLGGASVTAPRAVRLVAVVAASDTPSASATRAGAVRYAPTRPRTNHTTDQTRAPIAHAVTTTCGRAGGHRRWTIHRTPAPAPYHARTTREAMTSAVALSARAGPRARPRAWTKAASARHASRARARSRRWRKRNAAARMIPQAAVSRTATGPLRLSGGGGRLLLLPATGWCGGLALGRPL